MKRCLLRSTFTTLLLLCLSILGDGAGANGFDDPATDPAWAPLLGTWTVGYDDPILGRVEGTASMRVVAGAPAPEVLVSLLHPETRERLAIRSVRVVREAGTLRITLRGAWPVGPLPRERQPGLEVRDVVPSGKPVDAIMPSASVLHIAPGDRVVARVRGSTGEQAATAQWRETAIEQEITLEQRLPADGNSIEWRWSAPYIAAIGMRGQRVGTIDWKTTKVTGTESWVRSRDRAIVSAERVGAWEAVAGANGLPCARATLLVRGIGLPVAPSEVRFDDPEIVGAKVLASSPRSGTRTQDEITLAVDVSQAIAPGIKSFRLDDLPGVVSFGFDPDVPDVRFHRLANSGGGATGSGIGHELPVASEISDSVCLGETLVVSATFSGEPFFAGRLVVVNAGGREREVLAMSSRATVDADSLDPELREGRTLFSEPFSISPTRFHAGERLSIGPASPGSDREPDEWGGIELLAPQACGRTAVFVEFDGVRAGGASGDVPASDVVVDEPIRFVARVPAAQADALGEELELPLRVDESGETGKVTLRREPARRGATVVRYRSALPVLLGRRLSGRSLDDREVNARPIEVGDGEHLVLALGDATATVRVHDTAVRRRLGVRRSQLEQSIGFLTKASTMPGLPAAEASLLAAKLRCAKDGMAIAQSSELLDVERIAVLEAALSLLERDAIGGGASSVTIQGVRLAFADEANAFIEAIRVTAREIIRDAVMRGMAGLSIGVYQFVADETGVGDLYQLSGWDLLGRRISWSERILSGVQTLLKLAEGIGEVRPTRERVGAAWADWYESRRRDAAAAARAEEEVADVGPPRTSPAQPEATPPVAAQPAPRIDVRPRTTPPVAPLPPARVWNAEESRLRAALRTVGVPAEEIDEEVRRLLSSERRVDLVPAQVGVAVDRGIPPKVLAERLGGGIEPIAPALDAYYRDVIGMTDPEARKRLIARYLGEETPPAFLPTAESAAAAGSSSATERRTAIAQRAGIHVDPKFDALRAEEAAWREVHEELEVAQDLAERGHRGRALMEDLAKAEAELARVVGAQMGEAADVIERRAQYHLHQFDDLHEAADGVERAVGRRGWSDYTALRIWKARGCDLRESIVGQVLLNHRSVSPVQLGKAMGFDEATMRAAFDGFLAKTQGITDPAQRARFVDDYFSGS